MTGTAGNTGEEISIGTLAGTLDAVHLVGLTITDLSGTATVGELSGATIDTVTTSGTLTVTAANTGTDISIGTLAGTLDAVHLVGLTITDLSGTATVGELRGATIDTVTTSGTLTVTAANTGTDISIGTLAGTLDAVHLVALTMPDLSGTATVGELSGATIDTVTTSGTLTVTAANTGTDISIGTLDGTLDAV